MRTVVLSDGTKVNDVPDEWSAKQLLDHLAQQGYDVTAEQRKLGPVAVIGEAGLPAAAEAVGREGSFGQKVATGLGQSANRAAIALGQIASYAPGAEAAGRGIAAGVNALPGVSNMPRSLPSDEDLALAEQVKGGGGWASTAGDVAGSIGMTVGAPINALSKLPGAAAALRAAPRAFPIAGSATTAAGLSAAITPGDAAERAKAAMFSAGMATALPMTMGVMQGARRATTTSGRELGRAEALTRYLGPDDTNALIPQLRAPYPGAGLGVQPTAAMQAGNAKLNNVELGAWTKNPALYAPRQAQNAQARWDTMSRAAGTAQDLANSEQARDSLTKQLRQHALIDADQNPRLLTPIKSAVTRLLNGPRRVNPNVKTMAEYVQGHLDDGVNASSLYEIRKVLTGGFKVGDPVSAAAAGASRERRHLIAVIDNALNKSSGGKWNAYRDIYSTASEPVTSRKAMQAIRDSFERRIAPGDVPPVFGMSPGPNSVATKVSQFGMKQFGKTWKDRLSYNDRELMNEIIRDLSRQQATRKAAGGVGSDTAAKMAAGEISDDIGSGLVGQVIDMAMPVRGVGTFVGAGLRRAAASRRDEALAEVLNNPEKLADLLEKAKRAQRTFEATTQAARVTRPLGGEF